MRMKKIILLAMTASLMLCTACAQQRASEEDMGASDAGTGATDTGAAGTDTTSSGAADSGATDTGTAVSGTADENGTDSNETVPNERTEPSGQGEVPRIPDMPLQIPDGYLSPASEQGTLERLEYTTYESFSYEERTRQLTKTAYVYLPYGYSEDEPYNVFYLMHGGWANETAYLGTPEDPNVLKDVIDHAIQDGEMEPMLVVCPTYNNENPDDSDNYGLSLRLTDNYHNELLNDLIPAVEGKYSTYAEGTSPEELERSRDHRAFCGFSMGSVTTWHTFEYCLPYFRYFLPSSGDLTSDGQYMERIVTDSGYGPEDFFIYAMSGTRDFDYSAFSRQIQAMLEAPGGIFIQADNEQDGNLAYRVQEGNEHNGEAAMQYIYNGLVWLWKGEGAK